MLNSVLTYINNQLSQINFSRLETLAHIERRVTEDGEIAFPAIYQAKGEGYKLNFEDNTVYHRLDGDVAITTDDDPLIGCDPIEQRDYPMKVVAVFNKDIYGDDSKYINQQVCDNIVNILNAQSVTALQTALKMRKVIIAPTSYSQSSYDVWENEFDGIDYRLPSTHGIVEVFYTVTLIGNKDCFVLKLC